MSQTEACATAAMYCSQWRKYITRIWSDNSLTSVSLRRPPPHIWSDNFLTSDSRRRPPPCIWNDNSLTSDREGAHPIFGVTIPSLQIVGEGLHPVFGVSSPSPQTEKASRVTIPSPQTVGEDLQPVFGVTIPSPQTEKSPTLYLVWQFPHLRQSKKAPTPCLEWQFPHLRQSEMASTPYLEWQVPHLRQSEMASTPYLEWQVPHLRQRPPPSVWSDNSLTSDNQRRPPPCIWSNKSLTSDSRRRLPPHIWRHSMGWVPLQSFPACWRCSPRALWQGARAARRHASCRSLRTGWLTDIASNPPSSPTLPALWCHLFLHYWPVPTDLQQKGRFARETKQLKGTIKLSHDRRCLFTPFPQSLISLMVPVDVKHHAYLLTCCLELSFLLADIHKTHTL